MRAKLPTTGLGSICRGRTRAPPCACAVRVCDCDCEWATQPMQELRPVQRPPRLRSSGAQSKSALLARVANGKAESTSTPNHDLTKARTNPPPPNPTAPSTYSIGDPTNSTFRARALVLCVGQGSQSQQALGRQVISRSEQRRTGTGVGREEDSPQSAAARNRRRRRQSAGIGRSCERRGGSSRRRRAGTLPAR